MPNRLVFLTVASCVVGACGTELAGNEGNTETLGDAGSGLAPIASESADAARDVDRSDAAATVTVSDDASVDAAIGDGNANVESGTLDGGASWTAIRAMLGPQQNVQGSCTSHVDKLVSSTPACTYADVPTISGSGPCVAKITFADDTTTGAVVATVEELSPGLGQIICHAEVVAVVPPVTTKITIPLALQPNGSASGTGARPGTDTQYTLTITAGGSLTLEAFGFLPSRADRQSLVAQGGCPAPLKDSTCAFNRQL